jgi:large subunit ribosomal protein L21e
MTQRSNGFLAGRTRLMARHRKPSKLRVRDLVKSFSVGDSVVIVPNGNTWNAPHMRYRGRTAKVLEKRGSAYVVELQMLNAWKRLVVPAVHLQKAG